MKKQFALPLFLVSILIVAFAAVAGSGRNNDLPAPPAIGTTIDDFKLPDAAGVDHSLKSLMGKKGGKRTLELHGAEHFSKASKARKTFGGGWPKGRPRKVKGRKKVGGTK